MELNTSQVVRQGAGIEDTPQIHGLAHRSCRNATMYFGPAEAAVRAGLVAPGVIPDTTSKWHDEFRFGQRADFSPGQAGAKILIEDGEIFIYLWAGVVDDVVVEPASVVHLPRIAGSNVRFLPASATQPVVQERRRGRLPGCVARLADFRSAKAYKQKQIAGLQRLRNESIANAARLGDELLALGA